MKPSERITKGVAISLLMGIGLYYNAKHESIFSKNLSQYNKTQNTLVSAEKEKENMSTFTIAKTIIITGIEHLISKI